MQRTIWQAEEKAEEEEEETLTLGASKLVDGVDEALMKLRRPPQPRLRVGGENEAGVHRRPRVHPSRPSPSSTSPTIAGATILHSTNHSTEESATS